MSRRTKARVAAGVRAVHAEAAGAVRLDTIMPEDVPGLVGAAVMGDTRVHGLLNLLGQIRQAITSAPVRQPVACAACPAPVKGNTGGYVLVTGLVDAPAHGIGFVVCKRCGPTVDAVEAKGAAAAREYWPDMRPVQLAPGGRA